MKWGKLTPTDMLGTPNVGKAMELWQWVGIGYTAMNIGYTASENTVYDRLVVVTKGRGERLWTPKKKGGGAWHLGGAIYNVLNMRHKGRWHAFGGELAQIGTGVCLQQLMQQT